MASTPADTFTAHLVKLARTRTLHQPVKSSLDGDYPGREQSLVLGSYLRFDDFIPRPECPSLSLFFRPTGSQRGEDQALMCWDGNHGLFVNPTGLVEFRWEGVIVSSRSPVDDLRWFEVTAFLEADSNTLNLALRSLEFDQLEHFQTAFFRRWSPSCAPAPLFVLAACLTGDSVSACFDGKIERPRIIANQSEVCGLGFFPAQSSDTVFDSGKNAFHGKLVNCPQRAMTGHNWDGGNIRFTDALEQYGAIAFHSDDLTDADWEPFITWEVPNDLTPGMYGVELEVMAAMTASPLSFDLPAPALKPK